MDSFPSFTAASGPFNQCKLSPFITPYSASRESIIEVGDKQQVLTCGQVVLIGLEVRPPDDWSGSVEDLCKLFETYLQCIGFVYNLIHKENVVQSQACNPHTTVKADGLFWYDLANMNRIVMLKQPYGFNIFTTTKIDVRNSLLSKDLILSISLSAVYEAKPSSTKPTLTKKSSSNAKIDAEEREVRQLMERQRFSPPKPPTREAKIKVKIVSPVAVVCRSHEMGRLSTLITIAIENQHFQHSITVKEIVMRIGMTSIETSRDNNSYDTDDDETSTEYHEYQKRDVNLTQVLRHLHMKPVSWIGDERNCLFPVTINASESFNFAYEATLNTNFNDNILSADKSNLMSLLRGELLSTPCVIRWEEQDAVSDMYTEHDIRWSLGSTYLARNGSKSTVPHDLQFIIKASQHSGKINVPLTLYITIHNKSEKSVLKGSLVQIATPMHDDFRNYLVTENGVMEKDLQPQSFDTVSVTIVPMVSGTLIIDGLYLEDISDQSKEKIFMRHVYSTHVDST